MTRQKIYPENFSSSCRACRIAIEAKAIRCYYCRVNDSYRFIRMAVFFLTCTSFVACSKAVVPGALETGVSLAGLTIEYPHSDNFRKTVVHGTQYLSSAIQCSQCHGSDFSGGTSNVSCKTCHTHFPHEHGWAKPANHAKTFLSLSGTEKKQCLSCHAPDPAKTAINGDKIPKCADCHKAYPHDEGFLEGSGVHPDLAKSYDGKCAACHRNFSENMPNYAGGCTECHEGRLEISFKSKPHDQGWAKPQVHGKMFLSLADAGKLKCMKCHSTPSTDPSNGAQTPACADCHKAYPHDDNFEMGQGTHPVLAKAFDGKCTTCHRHYVDNMPNYGTDGCRACHTGVTETEWKKVVTPGHTSATPLKSATWGRMPSSKQH